GCEQPAAQRVEGVVQRERGFAEAGDALGPDVRRHERGVAVPGRQLAADVPELLEIVMPRALGGLDAERGVSARAAAARQVVAAFFLDGQREEPAKAIQALLDEGVV